MVEKRVAVQIVPADDHRGPYRKFIDWLWAGAWLVAKNVAVIGVVLAVPLSIFPNLYWDAIAMLPQSYYKIGSVGGADGTFSKFTAWNVNLDAVDDYQGAERLRRLMDNPVRIARLDKDNSVPGRSDPRSGGDELPGRTWEGDKCLFINDILLRAVKGIGTAAEEADHVVAVAEKHPTSQKDGKQPSGADTSPSVTVAWSPVLDDTKHRDGDAAYLAITVLELKSDMERHKIEGKVSDYFVGKVRAALAARQQLALGGGNVPACKAKVVGQVCPRIELWAKGTVAPCTIRPF